MFHDDSSCVQFTKLISNFIVIHGKESSFNTIIYRGEPTFDMWSTSKIYLGRYLRYVVVVSLYNYKCTMLNTIIILMIFGSSSTVSLV